TRTKLMNWLLRISKGELKVVSYVEFLPMQYSCGGTLTTMEKLLLRSHHHYSEAHSSDPTILTPYFI
ncbi:hypothetical protein HAX54_010871, partial [Datura stramonium]|nr:hypothetical protein [Datura stramonium]